MRAAAIGPRYGTGLLAIASRRPLGLAGAACVRARYRCGLCVHPASEPRATEPQSSLALKKKIPLQIHSLQLAENLS